VKTSRAFVLAGSLLGATFAAADVDIRKEQIRFEKGTSAATREGTIKGRQIVDYQLGARSGQSIAVDFKPSNLSAYFNVLPPGSETALFIGSTSGNHFAGELPADGLYTIRVYLMRSAARRNEKSTYTLDVSVKGGEKPAASETSAPFDETLELQGIRFHVTTARESSGTTLRIVPAGLEIDNSPMVRSIDGTVTGAEVADLNADGSPEIYVYVTGSDARGSLVAYSANRRKSLSEIYLPPLTESASKGYRGHDEFAVVENVLARRFPVYRDGDTDTKPTGGMRQLQYKLVPGEAGWILKVDKVVEY
jgi:hypothetical protein